MSKVDGTLVLYMTSNNGRTIMSHNLNVLAEEKDLENLKDMRYYEIKIV